MPKYSGLLLGAKNIVNHMQQQEKMKQDLTTTLLGKMLTPREYKPQTKEELLEIEGAKAGMRGQPTSWELQKEAHDEAFRRLGGSYMVGLDEESKIKYETLANQIYQELLKQYQITPTSSPSPLLRPTPSPTPQSNIRTEYNRLRAQGMSAEEVRRKLGIR